MNNDLSDCTPTVGCSRCDRCNERRKGTCFYAHDAMGWATWVLFLCRKCDAKNFKAAYDRESSKTLTRKQRYARSRSKSYPALGHVLVEAA